MTAPEQAIESRVRNREPGLSMAGGWQPDFEVRC